MITEGVQLAASQYGSQALVWDLASAAHLPWDDSSRPHHLTVEGLQRWEKAISARDDYIASGLTDFCCAAGSSDTPTVRVYERYLLRYMPRECPFLWLFCIPGMGKTTLARYFPAIIDMDYGIWRRYCGSPKCDLDPVTYTAQLANFMDACALAAAEVRERYAMSRTVILCNELDVIPFVQALGHPLMMVIPDSTFIPTWLEGVATREERKRAFGVQTDFDLKLKSKYEAWLDDWEECSRFYHVPLRHVKNWLPMLAVDGLICEGCRSHTQGAAKQKVGATLTHNR